MQDYAYNKDQDRIYGCGNILHSMTVETTNVQKISKKVRSSGNIHSKKSILK